MNMSGTRKSESPPTLTFFSEKKNLKYLGKYETTVKYTKIILPIRKTGKSGLIAVVNKAGIAFLDLHRKKKKVVSSICESDIKELKQLDENTICYTCSASKAKGKKNPILIYNISKIQKPYLIKRIDQKMITSICCFQVPLDDIVEEKKLKIDAIDMIDVNSTLPIIAVARKIFSGNLEQINVETHIDFYNIKKYRKRSENKNGGKRKNRSYYFGGKSKQEKQMEKLDTLLKRYVLNTINLIDLKSINHDSIVFVKNGLLELQRQENILIYSTQETVTKIDWKLGKSIHTARVSKFKIREILGTYSTRDRSVTRKSNDVVKITSFYKPNQEITSSSNEISEYIVWLCHNNLDIIVLDLEKWTLQKRLRLNQLHALLSNYDHYPYLICSRPGFTKHHGMLSIYDLEIKNSTVVEDKVKNIQLNNTDCLFWLEAGHDFSSISSNVGKNILCIYSNEENRGVVFLWECHFAERKILKIENDEKVDLIIVCCEEDLENNEENIEILNLKFWCCDKMIFAPKVLLS